MNAPKLKMNCVTCSIRASYFNLFTPQELETIDSHRYEAKYRAGEIVFKQGTICKEVISLTSGMVKIYIEGLNDKNIILGYNKPVSILAGPGTYVDNRHHYTVVAVEDITTCHMDLDVFKSQVRKNCQVSEEIIKKISYFSIDYYSKLVNLTQKQMPGRIATSLLYLYHEVFNDYPFDVRASRKDLAELSGMTEDSAGRVLQDLCKEGIIEIDNKIISILNPDKLTEISEKG